jgi:D-threo-aldose 1-dehydrogenase
MRAYRLGSSDVEVTAVGLGTAQLGDLYDALDEERATAIVDAAWTAGIRYFDTAPHYGLGLAERRLGVALASRPREHYAISSKVGRLLEPDEQGSLTRRWDFTADGVLRSIEESLERLQLDRLDIVLIHDPQGHLDQALDFAYPALAKLRDAGVIGAVGVGTGDVGALEAFVSRTDVDAVMIAGRLTLLEQPALARVVPTCAARGISVLNAGVFNSGLLATPHPRETSRYEYSPVSAELLERARLLAMAAERSGTTLPQAALAFAARDRTVASVVVGADNAQQISDTVRLAADERPLDDLWRALEADGLIEGIGSA